MNNEELKEKIKNLIHNINEMLKITYEENINLTDFNERMEEITGIYIYKRKISINPIMLDLDIDLGIELEKLYNNLKFYCIEILDLIKFYFDYVKEGEI